MTERQVPHSLQAEESLLGSAMLSPSALDVMVRDTEPEDFYVPKHRTIAGALRDLWQSGVSYADAVLVSEELKARDQLDGVGGTSELVRLSNGTPNPGSAPRYAKIIVEMSLRRQVISVAAETSTDAYGTGDVHDIISSFKERIGNVQLPIVDAAPSPTILDVMDAEAEYDWLVPGLIERRDRLILTGGEGGGKSTLLRQLAVTMAAAVHPFGGWALDNPIKVYYLDVENSILQFKRKSARLVDRVDKTLIPENLRIDMRTGGLELTRRHDASWLLGRLQSNRPDVFITGPVYKLHTDDPNKEEPARKLAALFDEIRERYGCTIILEAHSPHSSPGSRRPLRPVGASLWMRWPEFGFGLRKASDTTVYFEDWRGPRDERAWPRGLRRGMQNEWPWMENNVEPVDTRGDDEGGEPEPF